MQFPGAVIVGYGETPYHKRNQRDPIWYIAEAVRRALDHAGIDKREVDGLAVTCFRMPPDNATTIGHHLGMELRWVYHGVQGGAAGISSILAAARAIEAGAAEVVVCVAADSFQVDEHMELLEQFNRPMRDYLNPYGFGGANGIFALVQRRHMHEFGTTREQLGKLAVTQRANAALNPNALLREPMTLDDYLNARLIADPLRLYDCVLPCGGGDAVVLTSFDRAKALGRKPVRILAGDELHNYDPDTVVVLEAGWSRYRDRLFENAGLGHDDLDMVQLYDDYPIMEVIQLEDLGFCAKGEGGAFIERTDISLTGTLPINTGGGQLSCGQCGAGGGMIGVVEAVRQLYGEGGARQVRNAKTALVSGFGMVGYGRGLSTSALILAV